MALQILQSPKSFGQSAATGLGSKLQELAAGKLHQIEQRNEQKKFAESLIGSGYDPQIASLITQLPLNQRLEALSVLPRAGQKAEQVARPQPEFEQEPTITAAAEKQRAQELVPEQKEITQGDVNQLLQDQQQQQFAGVGDISNMFKNLGYNVTPEKQKQLEQKMQELQANPEAFNKMKQQYEKEVAEGKTVEIRPRGDTRPARPYAQAIQQHEAGTPLATKPMTGYEKAKLAQGERKEERARTEAEIAREDRAWKDAKDYIDDLDKAADAAEDTKTDIELQRKLDESGKLDKAGYVEMLKRADLDIPALMSPESQAYQKIAQNYQKNLKSLYGGSISNQQVDQLMKAVPTLMLSKKGRALLYPVLDKLADDTITKQEMKDRVIDENGGIPPRNLGAQVSKRIKPLLKNSAAQLQKEIAEIQKMADDASPLETATLATLGDLFGIAKKAAPQAIGTAVGWYFAGPLGGFVAGNAASSAAERMSKNPE